MPDRQPNTLSAFLPEACADGPFLRCEIESCSFEGSVWKRADSASIRRWGLTAVPGEGAGERTKVFEPYGDRNVQYRRAGFGEEGHRTKETGLYEVATPGQAKGGVKLAAERSL